MARFVKFHTLTWHQHPSMRVEIIGCQCMCVFLPPPPVGLRSIAISACVYLLLFCLHVCLFVVTNGVWADRQVPARVCMCVYVLVVCKSLMTLPPFVRVTASSEASSRKRRSCKAEDGLIVTNKAWCSKHEDGTIYYPHMPTGKVWKYRPSWMQECVCYLCVCMVTDFSAENIFCKAVHRRPTKGISHFCDLCSTRSPKSDESDSARATPTRM